MLPAKLRLGKSALRKQRKFLPPKSLFLLVVLRPSLHKLHPSISYDQIEQRADSNFKYAVPATLSYALTNSKLQLL
ncbi:MAG: hypothetical protein C0469_07215 [Cyanobacteria bacterium DS2.3.42]|nr:hypothetical protein [Cyanobacteria bacterium DS2.3.42]